VRSVSTESDLARHCSALPFLFAAFISQRPPRPIRERAFHLGTP
jgi:hypothetical protein